MPNKFGNVAAFAEMVNKGNWVVIDTETTGLGDDAQIVDIAIVAPTGEILMDCLVRPTRAIENGAMQAHGITNQMTESAFSWAMLRPTVMDLIRGKNVITYGATFDRRMFHQSDDAHNFEHYDWCAESNWACCMEVFAQVYGEVNRRYGTMTWKKLVMAAAYFELGEFAAHRALSDAEMTRKVALKIAQLKAVDKNGQTN